MYLFIVNPIAGNGKGNRIFSELKASKLYQHIEKTCRLTEYAGHAEEIARSMTELDQDRYQAIIVIGGDGTMHEVINGLQIKQIPLGFIPGGSGNDFARGCHLAGKPLDMLEQFITGKNLLAYWLGHYSIDGQVERDFVNSIGIGFDAEIARKANQSRMKKWFNRMHLGSFIYVFALIQVIFRFKPFTMEWEQDGKKRVIHDCWMITFANHPYYGGGMKIIPNAVIQPKVLPVLMIHQLSKWKILMVFITVFTGKHVGFKEVELDQGSTFTIYADKPVCYQVDGQTGYCQIASIQKNLSSIQILGGKS